MAEKRTKSGAYDARTVQGRKAIAREEKWAEIGSALGTYQEAKKRRDDANAERERKEAAERAAREAAELKAKLQPLIEQIDAVHAISVPKEKASLFDFIMDMRSRCFSTQVTLGGKRELVSKQKELCLAYFEKYNQGIYLAKMLYATEPEFIGLLNNVAEVEKVVQRKKRVMNEMWLIVTGLLIFYVLLFAFIGFMAWRE